VIPAGGSGTLTAEVRTHATQRGKLRKVVTVTTDDPVMRTVQLFVTLEVRPAVEVLPSPRLLVRLRPGERAERVVRLRRGDGKPLRVTPRPVAPGAPVTVEVAPRAKGEPPSEVTVRLGIGPAKPPLRRTVVVELATDHPEAPTVKLTVTVVAERDVEASPPRVTLGRAGAAGASVTSAVVRLRGTRGQAFAVTRVATDRPEVLEVTRTTSGRRQVHTIRVVLRPEAARRLPAGPVWATITVTTDDPGTPQLTVPVVIGGAAPRIPRTLRLPAPRGTPPTPGPR